jgi:hypothetical protein
MHTQSTEMDTLKLPLACGDSCLCATPGTAESRGLPSAHETATVCADTFPFWTSAAVPAKLNEATRQTTTASNVLFPMFIVTSHKHLGFRP